MSLAINPQRLRRLFTESTWVAAGQAAAVAGALLGVRLLTEFLDPAAYGELALAVALASLVNQSLTGPLGNGALRFYPPAAEADQLLAFGRATRQLLLGATAVSALVLALTLAALIVAGLSQWAALACAAMGFAVLGGYNGVAGTILNAARQRRAAALHQAADYWLRFVLAIGAVMWLGPTSTAAAIGYACSALLVGLSYRFTLNRYLVSTRPANGAEVDMWRSKLRQFSMPFAIFGLFAWMQLASDRWALEWLATREDVGRLAVLLQIGYQPTTMLIGVALQMFAPILFQRAGDATDPQRRAMAESMNWRLTQAALGATAVAWLLGSLFHREVFGVFVAEEYASVSFLLPWMLLAGGVFAAGQTLSVDLMIRMRPHAMTSAKIATAVLGMALNVLGAALFGIQGVVAASVLFSFSYFAWLFILSRKSPEPAH